MAQHTLRRITMKFGGTSVGDAQRIRSVAELVQRVRADGIQVVVVSSAMAKVTDQLVTLIQSSQDKSLPEDERMAQYFLFTKRLEQKHTETARQAIRSPEHQEEAIRAVYAERHNLERILLGSYLLGDLTPMGQDIIISAGERLVVPLLVGCLRDLGVDAVAVSGESCGIITDNNYGNALPREQATREGVRQALLPMLEKGQLPVVTGFFGRSEEGRIAILGRGGSDFSATLIGCGLDCDEIWIMKDVDGIKTTDPRLVPAAHTIPEVPYEIAAEMAMLGAKVLHPKSILPAFRQGVPVRIASSFEPDLPGTRLVPRQEGVLPHVTALTLVRQGGLVHAAATEMGSEGIVDLGMIDVLREQNVDLLASAAGYNGSSILWLLGSAELDRFIRILDAHNHGQFRKEVQRSVAILGIVGENLAAMPGIYSRVWKCMESVGVQPLTILHGASPNGMVIALPDEPQTLSQTLKQLHTELGLDP